MTDYILSVTREERISGELDHEGLLKKLGTIDALQIRGESGRLIQGSYPGTKTELYSSLGYNEKQVHIEEQIRYEICQS